MVEWFGMTDVAEKAVQPCSSRMHSEIRGPGHDNKTRLFRTCGRIIKTSLLQEQLHTHSGREMSNTERRVTIKRHTMISTPTPS